MKFRFYVADLGQGMIVGTDSPEEANDLAQCEDYFVVDTETGEWLTPYGREPVPPLT
jgi:hypothetical protein